MSITKHVAVVVCSLGLGLSPALAKREVTKEGTSHEVKTIKTNNGTKTITKDTTTSNGTTTTSKDVHKTTTTTK